MQYGELKVWTEELDGTPVIAAEGEVDLGTVDRFRRVTSEIVREKPPHLIFDLRKVSYIDSSGLGVLVAARRQLSGTGTVTVVTDQPGVVQALRITGLDRVLNIQAELEVPADRSAC
jgi:anti-anti-sigma factor